MALEVRTRYAPSPTGFMHVGNLRTALYEFLIAKSQNGKFILRIEDTDQERYVSGAVDLIYNTLKAVGLKHDEGPDIGGAYGPYVQSERMELYKPYAQQLVEEGKAYYCFCTKERLESIKNDFLSYDRHCRDLPEDEVQKLLDAGIPYVIRQKMPLSGITTFHDAVYGTINTQNSELDDQILIKTDGYPTYNFANVIDDHLMHITHVVRGSEYLSSTPKYNLLYEAFGWDIPQYIHLPLIMGKDPDGNVSKLSKRHGSVSFKELVDDGYLPEAIVNYIALLGWCPKENREIFTLQELIENFSIDRISKSPAIFDYAKLDWFNAEYIKVMSIDELDNALQPYFVQAGVDHLDTKKICAILQQRLEKFSQAVDKVAFLKELCDYNTEIFVHKKSKTNLENSLKVLLKVKEKLQDVGNWTHDDIHDALINLAKDMELKNGTVMWPTRIAISGITVTPGGAIEILEILGKDESLARIQVGIEKLQNV